MANPGDRAEQGSGVEVRMVCGGGGGWGYPSHGPLNLICTRRIWMLERLISVSNSSEGKEKRQRSKLYKTHVLKIAAASSSRHLLF